MKTALSLLFCLALVSARASILPTNTLSGHVMVSWAFATNLSYYPGIESNLFPLTFRVYATPSLSSSPMVLLTNIDATNFMPFQGGFVGTNWWASNCAVQCPITPGSYYFFVAASNCWGESDFSAPYVTPPPPPFLGNTLRISIAP